MASLTHKHRNPLAFLYYRETGFIGQIIAKKDGKSTIRITLYDHSDSFAFVPVYFRSHFKDFLSLSDPKILCFCYDTIENVFHLASHSFASALGVTSRPSISAPIGASVQDGASPRTGSWRTRPWSPGIRSTAR